ncbi:MbeB family mobilization protein, partial [Actinobacillus pleuropneumoniae]|uniref:MbeB family mobilization protein n=1 Tax=Actinobacillus pleuropneumoniae TaxID=715 RepID=UPI003B0284A7
MSKILDLAQTFQQTSQKELESTSEIVQNAIKRHEQNLIQQLQHAGNNLAENIQIEQAKLIKKYRENVSLAEPLFALTILALIAITAGVLTWQAKNAYPGDDRMAKFSRDSQRAEWGDQAINLQNGEGIKPCVAVDKDFINSTWGENLKVIEIHETKKQG